MQDAEVGAQRSTEPRARRNHHGAIRGEARQARAIHSFFARTVRGLNAVERRLPQDACQWVVAYTAGPDQKHHVLHTANSDLLKVCAALQSFLSVIMQTGSCGCGRLQARYDNQHTCA